MVSLTPLMSRILPCGGITRLEVGTLQMKGERVIVRDTAPGLLGGHWPSCVGGWVATLVPSVHDLLGLVGSTSRSPFTVRELPVVE